MVSRFVLGVYSHRFGGFFTAREKRLVCLLSDRELRPVARGFYVKGPGLHSLTPV